VQIETSPQVQGHSYEQDPKKHCYLGEWHNG
jgi:hypothetical protein